MDVEIVAQWTAPIILYSNNFKLHDSVVLSKHFEEA